MRFIVDESAGAAVVDYLRKQGHDVVAVAESMRRAADDDILTSAVSEKRILITNDRDLGELIPHEGPRACSVVLLRLKEDRPAVRVRVVADLIEQYGTKLAGGFTIASEENVRIRPALRLL